MNNFDKPSLEFISLFLALSVNSYLCDRWQLRYTRLVAGHPGIPDSVEKVLPCRVIPAFQAVELAGIQVFQDPEYRDIQASAVVGFLVIADLVGFPDSAVTAVIADSVGPRVLADTAGPPVEG